MRVGFTIAMVLFAGAAAGCSTFGEEDAEEKAMRIAKLLGDARKVIPELRDQSAKETGGVDPDYALKRLLKAEEQMEEARKLSPESHSPRQLLVEILHLAGGMYTLKRETLADQIKAYEDRKESPPERLVNEKKEADEKGKICFRRAIQEVNFYITHMSNRDQSWETKGWDLLHSSYLFLEEWQNAANALREFVRHFESRMTPETLTHNRELIRRYEAKALDEAE